MTKILSGYSRFFSLRSRVILYGVIAIVAALIAGIYGYLLPLLPTSYLKFVAIPIALLICLVIWMLPERDSWLEKPTFRFLCVFLFFWCWWPPYLSIIRLPGDPWVSPQRILIFLILVMFVSLISVSRATKIQFVKRFNNHRPLIVALAIVFGFAFLSIPFSNKMSFSLNGFMKEFMFYCIPFLLTMALVKGPQQLERLFIIFLSCTLLLACVSFYETTLGQTVWSYHIPREFFDSSEDTQRILTPKLRDGMFRVKVSAFTSLEYAEMLSLALPICMYYILENPHKGLKIIAFIAIPILFYAIIVSRSRLGLVGGIIAIANYVFFLSWRKQRQEPKGLMGPMMLVLYPASLVTLVSVILGSRRLSNMILGGGGQQGSTEARFEQWSQGLPLIGERPITGYGVTQSAEVLGYSGPSGVLTVDSYLLTIILETGVLAGLAFVFLFVYVMVISAKNYINSPKGNTLGNMGAALASIFLAFLIIKLVLSQRYNHTFLFMLAGAATIYPNGQIMRKGLSTLKNALTSTKV